VSDIHEVTELITPGPARALAGLFGVPEPGEELPLLWHLVYLLDRPPQDALGPDGHQHRGGMPVPPGPGLRRMFALQALLMAELARPAGSEYAYRLVAPLYEDQGLIVSAVQDGDAVRVSCRDTADRVTATGVIS
jgi:hydroxyacyl-ACP dehydratase HTD2-like protein with hotdog domain